jgi:Mrp family chromosome partitioning ATPase
MRIWINGRRFACEFWPASINYRISWLAKSAGWVYRARKMMIVMTNTKGGVGMSTLAAHLAIWLFDQGRKAALLDTDKQATAAGWIERAEKGITIAKATSVDAIRREWKKL